MPPTAPVAMSARAIGSQTLELPDRSAITGASRARNYFGETSSNDCSRRPETLPHDVIRCRERRQKADDVAANAARENEEPAAGCSLHERLGEVRIRTRRIAVLDELHGDHGAEAADLSDRAQAVAIPDPGER